MPRLNEYFVSGEFECKCGCGFKSISPELIEVLTEIREYYNSPVIITSGCRCIEHNKKVGGASNSQHIHGTAADFIVKGVDAMHVQNYLENKYPDKYGIGRYPNRTHLDVRGRRARWEVRK